MVSNKIMVLERFICSPFLLQKLIADFISRFILHYFTHYRLITKPGSFQNSIRFSYFGDHFHRNNVPKRLCLFNFTEKDTSRCNIFRLGIETTCLFLFWGSCSCQKLANLLNVRWTISKITEDKLTRWHRESSRRELYINGGLWGCGSHSYQGDNRHHAVILFN